MGATETIGNLGGARGYRGPEVGNPSFYIRRLLDDKAKEIAEKTQKRIKVKRASIWTDSVYKIVEDKGFLRSETLGMFTYSKSYDGGVSFIISPTSPQVSDVFAGTDIKKYKIERTFYESPADFKKFYL